VSDGVFLWAKLAVDATLQLYLAGSTPEQLSAAIEKMLRDVEEMHEEMLDRLPPKLKTEAAILIFMTLGAGENAEVRKLYDAMQASLVKTILHT